VRYSSEAARFWNAELTGAKDYSEKTAEMIDQEVRDLVDKAYRDTLALLGAHRDELERLAEALLKYETLDGPEVKRLLAGEDIDDIRRQAAKQADARRQEYRAREAADHAHNHNGLDLPGAAPLPDAT